MIKYKDAYLSLNSLAYQLYQERKFIELDKHIAATAQKEKELIEHYSRRALQEELRKDREASHEACWNGVGC